MTSPARERGLRRPDGRARRPLKPGRRKISQIATAAAAPAADPPAPAAAAVPGAVSPKAVTIGRKESWCCVAAFLPEAVRFCLAGAPATEVASISVAEATAAGDGGGGGVGEALKGGPVPVEDPPAGAAGRPEPGAGSSSGRVGGSGATICGGAGISSVGATGRTGAAGSAGVSGGSGAATIGGATAGIAGATTGGATAVPPICVGISDPISEEDAVAGAHDPPRFQFQIHPCIPVSIGTVIPEGAVSPHHVQFHVHALGAAAAELGVGLIAAAGSGLWTGVAGAIVAGAGAASGPGAEGV